MDHHVFFNSELAICALFLFLQHTGLQQFQLIFDVKSATQKIRGLNRDKA